MTSFRKFLAAALVTSALVLSACGSSTKSSGDTTSTTTAATTTTAAATTTVVTTTAPATTAAAVVTNPPATNPPATTPPSIINSFSVTNPGPCPVEGVTYVPPPSEVTLSWSVTGADSIYFGVDSMGVYEGGLEPSGSRTIYFPCDGNTHTYYLVAQKGGQQYVKSRTKGP